MAFKPIVANHDITQSSKPARLAIIRLNILVQKLIHMTTAFYDEMPKYSRSTLANISSIKELKIHPKFRLNQRYFLGRHFRSYNSKNSKTKTKNIYLKYFLWHRPHVCKTIRSILASILLFACGKYNKLTKIAKTVSIFEILVTSRIASRFQHRRQLVSYRFFNYPWCNVYLSSPTMPPI